MHKNKSFHKTNKTSKQISSSSSRALLQLSQITANSKDKSALMLNFSERSGYPSTIDLETTENNLNYTAKHKQKAKSNSKKQTYIRQKAPLSNSVINQIIEISNSLPIRNAQLEASGIMDKENQLIIFSKSDLQKNKNFSQTKKNKKLLLYENKENHDKIMSKSKSSYSQIIKGQPILCSIKIQPLEQNKNSHNFSCSQKRQSFDGRRSSFSSRRSSISFFPQEDFVSESKINEIKKSFLAKISLPDQNSQKPNEESYKMDNFLKKSHLNFYEQNFCSQELKAHELKQTRENQTQITPRQKKQLREKYLFKLDELNVIEDDIRKDASRFIPIWSNQVEAEKNLKKYRKGFEEVKQKYEKALGDSSTLKGVLFEQNKRYVMGRRISSSNFNSQKQSILFEVQKIHGEVKKKVFKKELQELMIFNMKVVLPSSQLMQSSMSCFDSHISTGINNSSISILQLYEQLMNQKAVKKYGMILKKQINNMNIYDNRTMNEYLKKLYELEIMFNKVQGDDSHSEVDYLMRIESLVDQIEQKEQEISHVQGTYADLDRKVQQNQRLKDQSDSQLQTLLNQIAQCVYSEYMIFQTGGKSETKSSLDSSLNESFTEGGKPVSEFRDLVAKKYDELYNRFRQVKEEKKMIMDSLNNYQ